MCISIKKKQQKNKQTSILSCSKNKSDQPSLV